MAFEESFSEMLEAFENEQKRHLKVRNGIIVDIVEGTVFVDIGERIEGVLPKQELLENGKLKYKIGDEIPVAVTRRRTSKGEAVLSYKTAINEFKRKRFLEKYSVGDIIEVTITELNKGGFVAVNENGIEFFMPKSESSLSFNKDNIGKKIEAKIIEFKRNGIVISRKALVFISKEDRILILKILPKLYKVDAFDSEIISLYKTKQNLRKILLDMLLELLKKDTNKVSKLFLEFEKIGIPDSYDVLKLKKIKSGQNDKFFNSSEEIVQELNQQNRHLSNDNIYTLNYFSLRFKFTKEDILIDLYDYYSSDENVKKVISFYIANMLHNSSRNFPKKLYKLVIENKNIIDMVTNYIDKQNYNSKKIKEFLEKFEKHQLLLKLNRR